MALKWYDGYEQYGDISHMTEGVGGGAAWSQVDGMGAGGVNGWALSTTNPATGSYHMRLTSGSNNSRAMRRIFGAAQQVTGLGYRFNVSDLPSREGIGDDAALVLAQWRDVSNVGHLTLIMGTDGSVISARGYKFDENGFAYAIVGRSDPCCAPGGYHHFEAKAKIDDSAGYNEVRINQVTVLNLTGIDTQNSANASAAQFVVGRSGDPLTAFNPNFGTFDMDDSFAWDDDASDAENTIVDFIGDKGCYYLPPASDTATSDFAVTGSATAYGAIDEVPPSGTDYLDTPDTTARTIVGVAPLPGNVSEVIAFMPVIYAQKDESGPVTMRGGIVSGVAETHGADNDPSTEYAYLKPSPKTVDPATGVAWANDAVVGLLIERTA